MHMCPACGLHHHYKMCSMLDGVGVRAKRKMIHGIPTIQVLYNDKAFIKFYPEYLYTPVLANWFCNTSSNPVPKGHYRVVASKRKECHFLMDSDTDEWVAKIYDISKAYLIINKLNLRG